MCFHLLELHTCVVGINQICTMNASTEVDTAPWVKRHDEEMKNVQLDTMEIEYTAIIQKMNFRLSSYTRALRSESRADEEHWKKSTGYPIELSARSAPGDHFIADSSHERVIFNYCVKKLVWGYRVNEGERFIGINGTIV